MTAPDPSRARTDPAQTAPAQTTPAQTAPDRTAYRIPGNLAWIDGTDDGADDELYLATVPDGHTVLLTGSARLIWLVAADGLEVLPGVAELAGLPPQEIADDVNRFLDDLVTRGLLAPAQPRTG